MENTAPARSPIWAWLFALLATVSLIDFIWYDHAVRDILGATGFGLMAYAAFCNAPASPRDATPGQSRLYWLSIFGLVLVLIAMVLRFASRT